MRTRTGKDWIPFWIDKWIFGSTRHELEPDEQSVWIDFLALAGKDDGYIRANPTIAYPIEQLAGLLCKSVDLVERTIKKCMIHKKIAKDKIGILYILNWETYQLSDRHKRRVDVPMSSKTATPSRGADSYNDTDKDTDTDNDTDKDTKRKGRIIFNYESGQFENITATQIKGWLETYPGVVIEAELKKAREWCRANPDKKKKNWQRFLVNWFAHNKGVSKNGGNKANAGIIEGNSDRFSKYQKKSQTV